MIDQKTKKLIYIIINHKSLHNVQQYVDLAEESRVLYSLAEIGKLDSVKRVGDKWLNRLCDTLLVLEEILPKEDYLVVRTYKYIDYVTVDVDVFVPKEKFVDAMHKFKVAGFSVESHDSSYGGRLPGQQVNIRKAEYLTIDLHQDFTWQKRQYLDMGLMFGKSRNKNIAGVGCNIPSAEIEFLLCMADITHERFNITLLDLIWIEGLSSEIKNWNLVFDQIKKYKWWGSFVTTAEVINRLGNDIYFKQLIPNIANKEGVYSFPVFISLFSVFQTYLETFAYTRRFPVTSFLYMIFSRLRYFFFRKMPYYSPWYVN